MNRLWCWLGRHTPGTFLIAAAAQSVTRHCIHCEAAATYPAKLSPAAVSDTEPLAAAYDLVRAVAAADVAGANEAIRATTPAHVAAVAIILAKGPPTSNFEDSLIQLAMATQIDSIEIGTPP